MTINDLRSGRKYSINGDSEVFVHETAPRFVVWEYLDAESIELRKAQGRGAKAKVYKEGHDDMEFALL